MLEEHQGMRGRTELYLHLLHSESFAAAARRALLDPAATLSPEIRGLLSGIDFERLADEQQHRIGDLCAHLQRVCPWHAADVGVERLRDLVRGYSDSDAFTRYLGRTLGEDYCLWAYGALREQGAGRAAEIARLDGVIAGLEAAPDKPSPWPSHEKVLRRESFICTHELEFATDARGEIPLAKLERPTRIWVELDETGALVVGSEPEEVSA